jgi:KDO2-lipid IV(A) lauroyltransferase
MWSYYLVRGLGYALSLLPFSFWYALSRFFAVLLEKPLRYRQQVINKNLDIAFPQASKSQRKRWRQGFYRHFTHILFETLKSLSISRQRMQRRMTLENREILEKLHRQGKGVMMVMGHQGNFEWVAMSMPLLVPQKCYAVYHPLKSTAFNRLIVHIRQRFGLTLFPMKNTYPFMLENPDPKPLYIFMADQAPHKGRIRYRAPFFGVETPVHLGVENLAQRCDLAVVFIDVFRKRPGHYRIVPRLLYEQVEDLPRYTVTKAHVNALENLIRQDPPNWLWSHNRWKNV